MGVLTLLSGPLYARFGGDGFWAMAALCAAALPVALGLRAAVRRRGEAPRPA
jgi:PPP family 3-phenylpropionic acid transporter